MKTLTNGVKLGFILLFVVLQCFFLYEIKFLRHEIISNYDKKTLVLTQVEKIQEDVKTCSDCIVNNTVLATQNKLDLRKLSEKLAFFDDVLTAVAEEGRATNQGAEVFLTHQKKFVDNIEEVVELQNIKMIDNDRKLDNLHKRLQIIEEVFYRALQDIKDEVDKNL